MKINNKETKFNIGDTVYFVRKIDNSVVLSKVSKIIISDEPVPSYELQNSNFIRNEKALYATNEEAEEAIERKKIKVYLSGAIANDKDYISKFMTAKSEVRDRGYSVLNPIETYESINDKDAKECMFGSIELLRQADVMLLLDKPETIESKGVQIEIAIANYCNIPIAIDYAELYNIYNSKFGKNKKENQ